VRLNKLKTLVPAEDVAFPFSPMGKVLTFITALVIASAVAPVCAEECRPAIVLYNGKISTMDAQDRVASSVTLEGDQITAVADGKGIPKHALCAKLIDLKGHRVIPGLIDSHNHIVVASQRPGHDVRIEIAGSVAEVQRLIHEKSATLPAGAWITAVAGWSPEQFSEKRMPTLAELDAATPGNPVYLQTGFDGPSATNSKGKLFFEEKGIKVDGDGLIQAKDATIAAYTALQSNQTFADKKRAALEVMAYAASVGLTMSVDKGGPWPVDTPGAENLAETGTRTNTLNPFTGYDHFLQLAREGKMLMRLRIFFYMQDTQKDLRFLKARLDNQFADFGNDWIKVSGIGERIYSGPFPFTPGGSSEVYEAAARLVSQRGWAHDEHAMRLEDEKEFTRIWEKINQETPLAPLRWCLAHVPGIDQPTLHRLQMMGVGVSAAGGRYTASNPPRIAPGDIPPFRMLVESGIHVGYGSDGGTVSPLNPWPHIYYMVSGKNSAGQLVASGQTLSRVQALRMYTSSQGWFTREEDRVGTIEVGKLADLVVLSGDILDPQQVSDEAIKHITSVLTIVGGKTVHDTGALRASSSGHN
jgi:predicted amidohydrolase YtcJ